MVPRRLGENTQPCPETESDSAGAFSLGCKIHSSSKEFGAQKSCPSARLAVVSIRVQLFGTTLAKGLTETALTIII